MTVHRASKSLNCLRVIQIQKNIDKHLNHHFIVLLKINRKINKSNSLIFHDHKIMKYLSKFNENINEEEELKAEETGYFTDSNYLNSQIVELK